MRTLLLLFSLALCAASCADIKENAYDFSRDGAHDGADPWEATYDAVSGSDFGVVSDGFFNVEEGSGFIY